MSVGLLASATVMALPARLENDSWVSSLVSWGPGSELTGVVLTMLTVTVTFDECYLSERGFSLAVGEFGEAVYAFTATRVREE